MRSELKQFSYGTKKIEYHLSYTDRKTLQIAVYPDKSVGVVAPVGASFEKVQKKLKAKSSWILKQQRYFSRFRKRSTSYEYISGETHKYLGKQYRLKVVQSQVEEQVKMKGAFFVIQTTDKSDTNRVKELLESWYREKAEKKFQERIEKCIDFLSPYRIPTPDFKLQKMQKRWGSYTASGNILLNRELIKYPSYCIDYVIIHEMCHVKFNNHSQEFYNLLSTVLPDWEYRKRRLEEID